MNTLLFSVVEQQRSKSANIVATQSEAKFYSFDGDSAKTIDLFTSPKVERRK